MEATGVKSIEFNPDALGKALEEKNLSQDKVNDLAGFKNPNTVNKIINRKRKATATDLLRLSAVLDIPAEQFSNR